VKKLTLILGVAVLIAAAMIVTACGGSGGAGAQLRLEITAPTGRTLSVAVPSQLISGIVSDPSSVVTVNDAPVTVGSDGSFSHEVDLSYGANRIVVAATVEGRDRPLTRTINVTRNLDLVVMSPEGTELIPGTPWMTNDNRITVSGRVSDPAARVMVTGDEVAVDEEGNFSALVDLYYTLSTLNVTAMIDAVDTPITQLITVQRGQ